MANYETMFLLSLKNGEEATANMVERIKNLISANGTLESVDEWGK
ncbi:MAG: 30S ribosomal protein S6, partial [Clostridia bacterium]|nr:30S ribosomal protein S6 [Clostridia bacterium]